MGSSPPTPWTEEDVRSWYGSYQRALASLTTEQLMAEADRVAGLIQQQSATAMTSSLLQARASQIDRLDQASDPMEALLESAAERSRPSPASTPEPPWVSLGRYRIGPRLAQKLILHSARAQARRDR